MDYNQSLISSAKSISIKIHEPFSQFLGGSEEESHFEITLLDCYKLSGHACHAITGAYLLANKAIHTLFPEDGICRRGDLKVEFESNLEGATGPKSNVISYITGAWADSGFPGLQSQFVRKGLVSYGNHDLPKNSVRFRRLSNGKSVTLDYNPSAVTSTLEHGLEFPQSWRAEIAAILKEPSAVIRIV